jgi:hypothetical protein
LKLTVTRNKVLTVSVNEKQSLDAQGDG